jgi:uncharacterized protein
MTTKIFVNLPVHDLPRSIEFFRQVGYTFNPQFTDETATCMVISEDIYAMLLTHAKFREFTPLPISDAKKSTEVLTALSCDSRTQVDETLTRALAAGATAVGQPQDYGFMYHRSFQDLDGHIWEYFWMDPSFVQKS